MSVVRPTRLTRPTPQRDTIMLAGVAYTAEELAGPLNNYTATADPTVNDDSGDGYSVGSIWVNITLDTGFICVDASSGAAVWLPFDSGESWQGAWSAGTYDTGDIVEHGDVIYQANTGTSDEPPGTDWDVLYTAPPGGGSASDYIAIVAVESDLVQYWPLNEASGTSFHDELGGTALVSVGAVPVAVGGPMLQRDVAGGSIGIDVNTQRVTRTAITWPAQWTMELWCMISRAGTDSGSLFAQWNGAGAMVLITGNDVRCYLNNDGTFSTWTATAAELRGRHHVLIGYDGTNRKLYWDGVEKVSAAATNPTTNQGGELCVGAYSGGGGAAERALRGDFAYYDTFDAGRAAAHYALGA